MIGVAVIRGMRGVCRQLAALQRRFLSQARRVSLGLGHPAHTMRALRMGSVRVAAEIADSVGEL